MIRTLALIALALVLGGCGGRQPASPEEPAGPRRIQLTSPAFPAGGAIPTKHAMDGANVSPALAWTNVPAGTRELALIVDDPDAPGGVTFVHWVLYKVPANETGLPEGIAKKAAVNGMRQGTNMFAKVGYDGPAPPRGKAHRYRFRLYALNQPVELAPQATADELRAAIAKSIIDSGELWGTYQK